jgi:nitrogen fixation-related uncharacterized protein
MGFTVFGIAATVGILYWALRARQFNEPDRAAHIPLEGVPSEDPIPETRGGDAKVLMGVLGLCIAMLAASVVVSFIW